MPFVDKSPLNYPITTTTALPIRRETRAPINNQDGLNDRLLTFWHDTTSNDVYMLVQRSKAQTTSLWLLIGGEGPEGLFPITKYVVGPVGEAGYQTIQSALDAANAAGGGAVWVKPELSPYNENLTLYDNTQVIGAIAPGDTTDLIINGVHTPPTSGAFMFRNIWFQSATHIFDSSAAGSAELFIIDSVMEITSGYTFNLPNWTGTFVVFNMGEQSITNGYVNNTGGATVFLTNASVGKGGLNSMITSGTVELYNVIVDCPIDFQTGTTGQIGGGSRLKTNVTFSNNSSLDVSNSFFDTGTSQAITYNSSGNSTFSNISVNSTNNPAIGGTGAGNFNIGSISFLNNANIAATVNITSGQLRSGESLIEKPLSGANVTSTTSNLSDTASSDASNIIKVAGTSSGDSFTNWNITSTQDYSAGIDNSETNDNWKLTDGENPSTGTSLIDIDTVNPSIIFGTTGAIGSPQGTLLQRPGTPANGMMRYNTDSSRIEFYENGAWRFLPDAIPGTLVQAVRATESTYVSTATAFPIDDTIPQITEGAELMTLAITPISTSNILYMRFSCFGSANAVSSFGIGLFQDATANALYATAEHVGASGNIANLFFNYYMVAGTESSTTFRIRYGVPGGNTAYINGNASNRLFGGVAAANFTIFEIEP